MSLGEILDRTFTLYRGHFWLFVGIMAMPQVVTIAVSVLFRGAFGSFFQIPSAQTAGSPTPIAFLSTFLVAIIVFGIVFFAIYSLALGATTLAVSRVYLGRTATIGEAYRSMRGRIGRLVAVVLSVMLRVFGAWLLASMALGLGIGAATFAAGQSAALRIVLVLFATATILGAVVLVVWLALRYSLSIPALLVEDLRAGQAIRRSIALTQGYRARIFLLALLMMTITYAGVLLFQGPFFVAILIASAHGQPPLWLQTCSSISGGAGAALTGPLMMIGLSLFYYDIHVRKEALDLQLMLDGVFAAAAAAGSAPPALSNP